MAAAGIYWNRDRTGTSRRRGTAEESPSPKWSPRRSPSSGDAGGRGPLGEVVGRAPPRGVNILVWRKQGKSLRGDLSRHSTFEYAERFAEQSPGFSSIPAIPVPISQWTTSGEQHSSLATSRRCSRLIFVLRPEGARNALDLRGLAMFNRSTRTRKPSFSVRTGSTRSHRKSERYHRSEIHDKASLPGRLDHRPRR